MTAIQQPPNVPAKPVPKGPLGELRDYLLQAQVMGALKEVAPQHLTPERLVRIALSAASRSPKILDCTPQSILLSLMLGAQLGLEVGSATGAAYLVPFKNNKKIRGEWVTVMEAQFIPGYRGLIDLAHRSGRVMDIGAYVVHNEDTFDPDYGRVDQPIVHKPTVVGDPGPMIGAWGRAVLVGKIQHVEWMRRSDIELIKARSRAADSGPWVTDEGEMWKKTVARRVCKYVPMSVDTARGLAIAIEAENRAEGGENARDLLDLNLQKILPPQEAEEIQVQVPDTVAATREDSIADKIAAKRNGKPADAPAQESGAVPVCAHGYDSRDGFCRHAEGIALPGYNADAPFKKAPAPPATPSEDDGFEDGPDVMLRQLVSTVNGTTNDEQLDNTIKVIQKQVETLPAEEQAALQKAVREKRTAFAQAKAEAANPAPKGKKPKAVKPEQGTLAVPPTNTPSDSSSGGGETY